MFGRVRFLETQLAEKDRVINDLLNRLMSRSYEQFRASEPDSFLNQPDDPPRATMVDSTGLISFDVEE